ncbi:MAG: hypothetical protein HON53_16580 [Planctomycetaceae bacterium]|jgi:hypothetical protein|nr:hypothetical protein [Planctomycetaceae bacterium]MBT6155654.1 hypothetical protein [Planctomycetaceae bacterium]MBT6486290.1 hypothetical protein [Planctomycetaceae bacterium]MBT6494271.1 hypothetical protein [Planctomycetaceae bacterium]
MNDPFPFGLEGPTAFYLVLYLSTLLIHIVFMNYVLAGSAYLAAHSVFRGRTNEESPLAELLRDWMPFMLSAAITAGIAPLLFLQVLYQKHFYTANLLLFSRWMAILPVLIAGFYLSYLLKSKLVHRWPLAGRAAVGCGTFACFAFVGWSWVENHLLSVQSQQVWEKEYVDATLLYHNTELLPRLTLWFLAAFPTMALVVGWQLWYRQGRNGDGANQPVLKIAGSRRTAVIAVAGIIISTVAARYYWGKMSLDTRDTITGPVALPYLVMAIVGGVVQLGAWVPQYLAARLSKKWLIVCTAGLVINFIGMAVVNEATRLAALDITELYAKHKQAREVGGLFLFLLFLAINSGLMLYCLRLVRGGWQAAPKD